MRHEPVIRFLAEFFDADPRLEPALRLRTGAATPWRVTEEALLLGDAAYPLEAHTLGGLLAALRAAGAEVVWHNPDLVAMGAAVLWPGAGELDPIAGGLLQARTSLLHALTVPAEHALQRYEASRPSALAQLSIATAEGAWLDRHGELYGIPRPAGMSDDAYHAHLLAEILRLRSNPRAMEGNLRRLLGADVRVIEPWQWVARFGRSRLSTDQRFQDGQRWAHNLLHLAAHDPIPWDAAQAIAEADRAAGNILLAPAWAPLAREVALPLGGAGAQVLTTQVRGLYARNWQHPRWDLTPLSDYGDLTRNLPFIHTTWRSTYLEGQDRPCVGDGTRWVNGGPWGERPWCRKGEPAAVARLDQGRHICRGDATFSEDAALGDLNTRFAGGSLVQIIGADRRWSADAPLSGYAIERRHVPICEWTEAALAAPSAPAWPGPSAIEGRWRSLWPLAGAWVAPAVAHGWDGTWGTRAWAEPLGGETGATQISSQVVQWSPGDAAASIEEIPGA